MKNNNQLSTNFWMSIIMLVTVTLGILGVNVNPDDLISVVEAITTKQITAIVLAVVAAAMALYNAFKSVKLGSIKDVFKNRNWYTALIAAIAGIFSSFQLSDFPVEQAEQLTDAIFSGNLALIISAGWTLAQTLWFIFKNKGEENISTAPIK